MRDFEKLLQTLRESQDKQEVKSVISAVSAMAKEEQLSQTMWEQFMMALEERFQREANITLLWELLMVIAGVFVPLDSKITDRLTVMLIFIAYEIKTLSEHTSIPIRLDFSGNLLVNAMETGAKAYVPETLPALVILATDFEVVGPITTALAGKALNRLPA